MPAAALLVLLCFVLRPERLFLRLSDLEYDSCVIVDELPVDFLDWEVKLENNETLDEVARLLTA